MVVKIVSACLAGINCKYNGGNSANEKVIRLVREGMAIPVCPEQLAGFGVPREQAEIRTGRVFTKSGRDVTAEFQKGAEEMLRIAKMAGVKEAILKARSPSCGKGQIYGGSFSKKLVEGNGIAAELLMRNGIAVLTEEEL